MSKGIIFNIEEFAVHDGPGIRKLVFFKGCPLRCSWCHNPEGISFGKEWMTGRSGEHRICGQEFEAEELANELLKGKEILNNSGGGITISGGEPLAQPAFLFDLIELLKPINIAVETSGHAPAPVFQRMVSVVDLVLLDIKHTNSAIHKKYTGVDNYQILENLEFLCGSDTDFYIRVPLIPEVNDTRENMEKTALLIKDAKHLKGVELLPYHQTAGAKYPMVNKNFEPGFDTTKKVNVWKDVFKKFNIKITVL
jgi:pyruvate formate lyase activating enzyme